ncbi:MAG: hypothetical protein WCG03_07730 [Kiritimatiellales bacterium]
MKRIGYLFFVTVLAGHAQGEPWPAADGLGREVVGDGVQKLAAGFKVKSAGTAAAVFLS